MKAQYQSTHKGMGKKGNILRSDVSVLKSIKSIKIVDSDQYVNKQNITQEICPQSPCRFPFSARQLSPISSHAHQFSFKKQAPHYNPLSIAEQQCDSLMMQQKICSQQKELKKLERMLKSMRIKVNEQQVQYREVEQEYSEYETEIRRNDQLKQQIYSLKDLMKQLLIQKENLRMMTFYQGNY